MISGLCWSLQAFGKASFRCDITFCSDASLFTELDYADTGYMPPILKASLVTLWSFSSFWWCAASLCTWCSIIVVSYIKLLSDFDFLAFFPSKPSTTLSWLPKIASSGCFSVARFSCSNSAPWTFLWDLKLHLCWRGLMHLRPGCLILQFGPGCWLQSIIA